MNKFDTETTTLKALTKRKRPDCVSALTELFQSARKEGLGLRESYWYAGTVHLLRDHEGHRHEPELDFEATDENARQIIIDELMRGNSDGQAEDRVDLAISWYERFRSWGASVARSFLYAAQASQEEWETAHDLPESEAVAQIYKSISGDDPEVVEIREMLLKTFYRERREGENVYASLEAAREKAEEWLVMQTLFAGMGVSTQGRSYLDRTGGGYLN